MILSGAGDFERERSWLQDPCLLGDRGGACGLQMMMIGEYWRWRFHEISVFWVPQNQLKLLVVIGKSNDLGYHMFGNLHMKIPNIMNKQIGAH